MIIVTSVLHRAFGTYRLSSVMSTFPREILEAAEIDGASRWQILTKVVIPIMGPTLMVPGTFFFIWTWNDSSAFQKTIEPSPPLCWRRKFR
jgi:raffinose/stachyose/melibiose transport system permease protein